MSLFPLESIEVVKQKENKDKSRIIDAIRINSYIGSVLSWIAFIVTAGVFYTSTTLTQDKRVFFATILAVVAIGLQILVWVVRSEPIYSLTFTTLIVAISFLSVGLSVAFAS